MRFRARFLVAIVVCAASCATSDSHSPGDAGDLGDASITGSSQQLWIAPSTLVTPIAPPTAQNSLDTVDPSVVIPNIAMLVPDGVAEPDVIPDTLDLSEMAASYLVGITSSLLPEYPYFHVP